MHTKDDNLYMINYMIKIYIWLVERREEKEKKERRSRRETH